MVNEDGELLARKDRIIENYKEKDYKKNEFFKSNYDSDNYKDNNKILNTVEIDKNLFMKLLEGKK